MKWSCVCLILGLLAFAQNAWGQPAGSLAPLPIIESEGSAADAYIPSEPVSISDGQIYLEREGFWEGIRPDFPSVSFGGKLTIPTKDDPDFYEPGGGLTFTAEWKPTLLFNAPRRPVYISPVCSLDVLGAGFSDQTQLNQLGGVDKEASHIFQLGFSPGLLMRVPLCERANFVVAAGPYISYLSSPLKTTPFDPNKDQAIVNQFNDSDWATGWSARTGVEVQGALDCIYRFMIGVEGYTTQMFTAKSHYDQRISLSLEVVLPR